MFITRESDYAIRIIRALSGKKKKTAQDICKEEQIPRQYGYKILKKLENARLVSCYRGAAGGYVLVKSLSSITILDVLDAINDEHLIVECLAKDFICHSCSKVCHMHTEFSRIQRILVTALKEKSLAEIFFPRRSTRKK